MRASIVLLHPTMAPCIRHALFLFRRMSKLSEAYQRRQKKHLLWKSCDLWLWCPCTGVDRFQGAAGTKMASTCVSVNYCGTHAPGWLNGPHPTVADGQVTRLVCFHYFSNCCQWSINVSVRNCGEFFVYYINRTPPEHTCHLRYCGAD